MKLYHKLSDDKTGLIFSGFHPNISQPFSFKRSGEFRKSGKKYLEELQFMIMD
jgi:hypothetical protein